MSTDDRKPNDEESLSQLLSRRKDSVDSLSDPVKKGLNLKALGVVAGLAVAGTGSYVAFNHASTKKPAQSTGAADSLSWAQQASGAAVGIRPGSRPEEFQTPSSVRPSLGDSSPTSDMSRLAALQDQIRRGNQPGSPAGTQGGEPGQGPAGAQSQGQGGPQSGSARMSRSGGGGGVVAKASILPPELRIRMQPEYEEWIQKNSSPAIAWQRADGPIAAPQQSAAAQVTTNGVPGVDANLQNLYQTSGQPINRSNYLPAGTELTCVTDHVIQTDYPSTIRATVIAPEILKGGKILINYSGVTQERAQATPSTLVLNRNGAWKEYKVSGVIRTDLPLLNGDVNHHYARRIVPLVANAGIAGGAVYLASRNQNGNISTQDQIWNNMAVAGVQGIQTEISKVNDGKPEITVTVPSGQEFTVLLTQGFDPQ